MTNEEAIKYLIQPFATSTKSYNEYLKQKEAYELAIKALEERPKGKWRSVGFEKGYAFCICSECGNTTRLYRDSKNEFCCIADIRNKVIACLYCGADMRGDV